MKIILQSENDLVKDMFRIFKEITSIFLKTKKFWTKLDINKRRTSRHEKEPFRYYENFFLYLLLSTDPLNFLFILGFRSLSTDVSLYVFLKT